MTRDKLIAKLDGERRTAWDDCEYDLSRLFEEIIEDVRRLEPERATMRDERWRPASEPPEIPESCGRVSVLTAARAGPRWLVGEGYYDRRRGFSGGDEIPVTHWRPMPEPPTPEQEARREMEERPATMAVARWLDSELRHAEATRESPFAPGAGFGIRIDLDVDLIRAFLREWAAKGVTR